MDNKWNKCEDVMPPLGEKVLILYKDKTDELKEDNLFWGLSMRCKDTNFGYEKWSYYTQYQGYYEVVYWMPLPNMPRAKDRKEDWYDIPLDEMTLKQARQDVKEVLFELVIKAFINDFKNYQKEWLTNHNDIEFDKPEEDLLLEFLEATANCYVSEHIS